MSTLKKADHALIAFKAAANLVPVFGGALASLISDYIPLSTHRSVERATELLKEELTTLGDRIDAEKVDRDQFSDLFKSCYLVIVRTSHEAKLRAAAALLANLLLKDGDPDKVSYTELDHFVRSLDALSVGAIAALGAAQNIVVKLGAQPDAQGDISFRFEDLQSNLKQFAPALLMGLLAELNALNLLRTEGRPALATGQYGNYPLTLTTLGNRFIQRFLKS
jgi:hypothetical protein